VTGSRTLAFGIRYRRYGRPALTTAELLCCPHGVMLMAQTQWKVNGGKCGVCGDPWNAPEPRDHELGGRYVPVVLIVRRYRPGDVVPVVVELTAAHAGYFEFRVCPVQTTANSTSLSRDPTPECLDNNVLSLVPSPAGHDRGTAGRTRSVL